MLFEYFEKILNYCEQSVCGCPPPPANKENEVIDPVLGHGDQAHGDWSDSHRPEDPKEEIKSATEHGDQAHGDWGDSQPPKHEEMEPTIGHGDSAHGDSAHGDWGDSQPPKDLNLPVNHNEKKDENQKNKGENC